VPGSDHFEHNVNIAPRGMGIGADPFVSLADQCVKFGLRKARVLDPHLHRDAKAAGLTRADRDGTGNLGFCGIALRLFCNEVERSTKAGSIARSEKCSGVAKPGLPWPPSASGNDRSALMAPSLLSV